MALLRDDKDKLSTMRVIAFYGALVGAGGVLSSIVAMFMRIDGATAMAAICAGLVTTAMGLKFAQKTQEVKK